MIVFPIILTSLFTLVTIPMLVWMERRVAALIQDRLGPNRCNIRGIRLGGLIQPIADMIKLLFKEEFYPKHIKHKFYYILAPGIVFASSFLSFMVIPYADDITLDGFTYHIQALPVELGVLWVFAFAGLGVYGIIIAGWASHNKYSILGALRASSQVISYEIAMGLAIVSMLITYNSISLNEMVRFQGQLLFGFIPAWGIILQPLAGLIFIVTAFAETNRAPFDAAEGESEIVAGYHTEYSAMKFALFFMGEYIAMSAASALIVSIFFGGYQVPWLNTQTMSEHLSLVLLFLMISIPLLSLGFISWMKVNNSSSAQHIRERQFFTIFITVFVIFLEMFLFYLLSSDISAQTNSIFVMIVQIISFAIKVMLMNFVFVWVRWTFPRFRYDQTQDLGWKILLPLSLFNIFITAIVVVVGGF
nr:complex I subunit 1 family protein [Sulfurimonas sp. MAG313]